MVKVLVRENNVEQALRVLKKKGQKEGLTRAAKERKYFETGTAKRKRKKNEARRRERKRIYKERQILGF
ncbi:MAG: 30S ribosomal protein S21 [Rickettsiales bacterium]|jgi:small subunit ribosomal protein S21|nr:30S ribosomal protein S21 [Rickettsiales bacterium]